MLLGSSLDGDFRRLRRNAVSDDKEFTRTGWNGCGNVEFRGYDCGSRRDTHCAVVMRGAIVNVLGGWVFDADDGIVGRHLRVVAIHRALRQAVELRAGDSVVGAARSQRACDRSDGRLPRSLVGSSGGVELYGLGPVGEQNLSRGQN